LLYLGELVGDIQRSTGRLWREFRGERNERLLVQGIQMHGKSGQEKDAQHQKDDQRKRYTIGICYKKGYQSRADEAEHSPIQGTSHARWKMYREGFYGFHSSLNR